MQVELNTKRWLWHRNTPLVRQYEDFLLALEENTQAYQACMKKMHAMTALQTSLTQDLASSAMKN